MIFGLTFQPYVTQYFPKTGFGSVVFSPQMFFLFATVVISWLRHLRPIHFGLSGRRIPEDVLWGFSLGLLPTVLTIAGMAVLTLAHAISPFLPRSFFGGPPLPITFDATNLFILVVLAPVTEELFFRGILLRSLRESYSPIWSVIFSAVIFMGGHGGFKIGPLLLGLITAPLTLITGSVLPAVVFHAISNAYGPLLVEWFPNLYRYLEFLFQ
jgi:membrane protease YdiL (CAAX protease family)